MKKSRAENTIDLSHHAYLVVGSLESCSAIRNSISNDKRVVAKDGHDFIEKHFETLTIDVAREIKSLATIRPVEVELKVIIIETKGITVEAQNALLKLLEEPADFVRFFLVVPSLHLVLPTVKSRMALLDLNVASAGGSRANTNYENRIGDNDVLNDAEAFIAATLPKRLDIIKKLTDEISKEKKTKYDAKLLLNAIEMSLYETRLQAERSDLRGSTSAVKTFESISYARQYLDDRSPSVKMLLEYVAMNI
jgi:DNA polymerase III delta prime subunit